MDFVAVCWQLVWEISIPELFTLLHWPPSVLVLPISLQICHLSMFLVLCSPGRGGTCRRNFIFLLLHRLNVLTVLCKGIHSPLCSGTCCYTGHFLQLAEVFWLKFMFSRSIPCSPELLQSLLLYKCLWLNPCCTTVVRKHSFSHTGKRREEGALMIQRCEALAGPAHETPGVLQTSFSKITEGTGPGAWMQVFSSHLRNAKRSIAFAFLSF